MTSSLALGLVFAALAITPGEEPEVTTNAVLASLEAQDPAAFYVAQVPATGNGAARPSLDTQAATNPARRTSSGNPYARLARVPNMFGDSLAPNATLLVGDDGETDLATGLPLAGGGRYLPIGENNKPIPVDRVYFLYNGFNNAVTTTSFATETQVDSNIHRYTFGLEKTFFDEWASIELRLPLTNSFSFEQDGLNFAGGNMGNLNLVYKQLLVRTEEFALATGVGLALPTGSAIKGRIFGTDDFQIGNNATYVLPYIGAAYNGDNNVFAIAYAQLDIAASGDQFTLNGITQGKLNASTLARFDLSTGYWVLRDLDRPYLSGVALVAELHYVTTLTDGDQLDTAGNFTLGYSENRFDFLNTTLGLHWQITDLSNFRIGGVFPMNASENRQFDSELQMSFNRMF